MYRFVKNTHLILGVASFFFLLMYSISAVQMSHDNWFSMKPAVTRASVSLPPGIPEEPHAIALALSEHGVRGAIGNATGTGTGFKFEVTRPGTLFDIEYVRATREARIQTRSGGLMIMLNRIHHLSGMSHGYGPTDAWGIFVAAVSVMLILIGATGIYLWFSIRKERLIGLLLLAINLGICVTLLILIRTA